MLLFAKVWNDVFLDSVNKLIELLILKQELNELDFLFDV